jgi:hypothetical protein
MPLDCWIPATFDHSNGGAIIAGAGSGVRLKRLDAANQLGYPTLIEVKAGPFCGSVRDDTIGSYSKFLNELRVLYEQLSGSATLKSYEGFSLVLTGDRRGAIWVSVVVIGEPVPSIRLSFEFGIDQSYLPEIIRAIADEFPPPTRMLGS